MKPGIRLVILCICALLSAACSGAGGNMVVVNMREFAYAPNDFSVPAGAEVTLKLNNLGALLHNFYVMERGSEVKDAWTDGNEAGALVRHEKLEGGESHTLTFTAPSEPGEYQYLCSVPAHLDLGMHGVMTVVAP